MKVVSTPIEIQKFLEKYSESLKVDSRWCELMDSIEEVARENDILIDTEELSCAALNCIGKFKISKEKVHDEFLEIESVNDFGCVSMIRLEPLSKGLKEAQRMMIICGR